MTRTAFSMAIAAMLLASPCAAEGRFEQPVPIGSHDAAAFYPDEARRLYQEGDVVVTFTIGVDGTVLGAAVRHSSGSAALDAAGLAAAVTWRYKPATLDGKPIAAPHNAVIRFNLYDPGSIFGSGNADADDCSGSTQKTSDLRLAACTQVLATPDLMPSDRVVALRKRGSAYAQLHRIADALTDIDAALALAPDDYRTVLARGDAYFALAQYPRATAEYDRAIALQPDNGFAYYARGVAHARGGQFDSALKDVDDAIRLIPDSSGVITLRASIEIQLGQYDKAIADATEALRLSPNLVPALTARESGYGEMQRNALAIADADSIVAQMPASSYGYELRCQSRVRWGQELDRALADCNKALELDPKSGGVFEVRSAVYFRLARYAEAIADCDAAMALDGRGAARLYIRGLAKLKSGDAAGGKADIDAATLLEPNIAKAFTAHGMTP